MGERATERRRDPRRSLPPRGELWRGRGPELFRKRKVKVEAGWGGVSHRLSVAGQAPYRGAFIHQWVFTEHLLHARRCSGCQGFKSEQKQWPCSPGAWFLLE